MGEEMQHMWLQPTSVADLSFRQYYYILLHYIRSLTCASIVIDVTAAVWLPGIKTLRGKIPLCAPGGLAEL